MEKKKTEPEPGGRFAEVTRKAKEMRAKLPKSKNEREDFNQATAPLTREDFPDEE